MQHLPINHTKSMVSLEATLAKLDSSAELQKSSEPRSFKPILVQKAEEVKDLELKKYKVRTMMMIEMECETEDASATADRFLEGLAFTGGTDIKQVNSVIYPISIERIHEGTQ